jgi:thioredoxin reductase (NADPH)
MHLPVPGPSDDLNPHQSGYIENSPSRNTEGRGLEEHDIIILGCGPAGIQAGIHAARRGAKVLVLGKLAGSALAKGHIENYAFVDGVASGAELLRTGLAQLKKFGAALLEEDAIHVSQAGDRFIVRSESGTEHSARAVILATGIARKRLGVPGEKELEGKGVSYCVDCDANFFKKKRVVVTGDGSAAASGALHLLHFTPHVTLIAPGLNISAGLMGSLRAADVKMVSDRKVKRIVGDDAVTAVELSDGSRLEAEGVFIEKGAKGVLSLGAELGLAVDDQGNLAVDQNQATNVFGIYGAGDVTGPPWQMAKAVGEGCVAGTNAATYAKNMKLAQEGPEDE